MDNKYMQDKDWESVLVIWRYVEGLQEKYPNLQWGWNGFGPMAHEGGY